MTTLSAYRDAVIDALVTRYETGEQWPEAGAVVGRLKLPETCGACNRMLILDVVGYLSPGIPCPNCHPGAWCGQCTRAVQCPNCGAVSM